MADTVVRKMVRRCETCERECQKDCYVPAQDRVVFCLNWEGVAEYVDAEIYRRALAAGRAAMARGMA